eukprot:1745123-Rhodomonas_salina.2
MKCSTRSKAGARRASTCMRAYARSEPHNVYVYTRAQCRLGWTYASSVPHKVYVHTRARYRIGCTCIRELGTAYGVRICASSVLTGYAHTAQGHIGTGPHSTGPYGIGSPGRDRGCALTLPDRGMIESGTERRTERTRTSMSSIGLTSRFSRSIMHVTTAAIVIPAAPRTIA